MTIKDVYDNLKDVVIRDDFINQVEFLFGIINNDEIKSFLSLKSGFYSMGDNFFRKLDDNEILETLKYLAVDMTKIHLIPLFDISDNDFISYDVQNNEFTIFNIQEEIKFQKTNNFLDYLTQV